MAAPPVAPPRKGRQTAAKPDLIVEDQKETGNASKLEADDENSFRESQENCDEKEDGELDRKLQSDCGETDRTDLNPDREKSEETQRKSEEASFSFGTAKGVPNVLGRELKELMKVSKEKDSIERTNALLDTVRRINEYLETGDHMETEIEEDSQAGVIPIQIGTLNFQIEADKLEGIFMRAQNNEGSVEELLADHFVRNVAEIIEGSKEKESAENDLEAAFREKLRAKVKAEGVPMNQSKGVSFATGPGNEADEEKKGMRSNVASVSGTKQDPEVVPMKTGGTMANKQPVCENAKQKIDNVPKGPMVRDIWDWSEKKSLERIIFESNDAQWLDMVLNPVKGEVKCSKCSAKVNCLAICLANRVEGENVVWRRGALPHGFKRLMDLEAAGLMMVVFLLEITLRLEQQQEWASCGTALMWILLEGWVSLPQVVAVKTVLATLQRSVQYGWSFT
nr:uncharacterized protein LOC109173561 [Ipomoea trifida]